MMGEVNFSVSGCGLWWADMPTTWKSPHALWCLSLPSPCKCRVHLASGATLALLGVELIGPMTPLSIRYHDWRRAVRCHCLYLAPIIHTFSKLYISSCIHSGYILITCCILEWYLYISCHLRCLSFRQFGLLRPLWTLRCFIASELLAGSVTSSGVFRRGVVGVKTPHDLTDEQAYTAICNLFIS